jgi:hypothetical protein
MDRALGDPASPTFSHAMGEQLARAAIAAYCPDMATTT